MQQKKVIAFKFVTSKKPSLFDEHKQNTENKSDNEKSSIDNNTPISDNKKQIQTTISSKSISPSQTSSKKTMTMNFVSKDSSIQVSGVENQIAQSNPINSIVNPNLTSLINDTNNIKSISDEEDPLDAYMKEIQDEVDKTKQLDALEAQNNNRLDLETENEELKALSKDEYNQYLEAQKQNIEYDEDGNPIEKPNKHNINYLPTFEVDVQFKPFRKQFYKECETVTNQDRDQLKEWMIKNEIKIESSVYLLPIHNFDELSLSIPPVLLNTIHTQGLMTPTPVQSQCLPYLLSGYSLIGVSRTGSGKTYTYLWPLLTHILDQPALQKDDGPIALILVPTRELAEQVAAETKKFINGYDIKVLALVGGASSWEQKKSLFNRQPEICIATPGRLCDHMKDKYIRFNRITFLVLDEADRMLSLGFEGQLRSITNQIRKDRQTLFFSATFPPRIERFAYEMVASDNRVIKIRIGKEGASSSLIEQKVILLENYASKWIWLSSKLQKFITSGKVLIFVSTRNECEELTTKCSMLLNETVQCIHGDKMQSERESIIRSYHKNQEEHGLNVLIATDIAARGLDIQGIQTVINYDVAKNIDIHIHRIGRTGRMGKEGIHTGIAYTLLTKTDKLFAVQLVRHLKSSNQMVPDPLMKLASEGGFKETLSETNSKHTVKNMLSTNTTKQGLGFSSNSIMSITSQDLGGDYIPTNPVTNEIKKLQEYAENKKKHISNISDNNSVNTNYNNYNNNNTTTNNNNDYNTSNNNNDNKYKYNNNDNNKYNNNNNDNINNNNDNNDDTININKNQSTLLSSISSTSNSLMKSSPTTNTMTSTSISDQSTLPYIDFDSDFDPQKLALLSQQAVMNQTIQNNQNSIPLYTRDSHTQYDPSIIERRLSSPLSSYDSHIKRRSRDRSRERDRDRDRDRDRNGNRYRTTNHYSSRDRSYDREIKKQYYDHSHSHSHSHTYHH